MWHESAKRIVGLVVAVDGGARELWLQALVFFSVQALVEFGTIAQEDVDSLFFTDDPEEVFVLFCFKTGVGGLRMCDEARRSSESRLASSLSLWRRSRNTF